MYQLARASILLTTVQLLVCSCLLIQIAGADTADEATAVTLTETLAKEQPSKLVLQARENGDVVRGAILFHQGKINCAKCHLPADEKNRIGPDLSRLGNEVADESLIESILHPSKIISKGYETLSVLTVDGRIISGMLVSEDDKQVVLRSGQDFDQLITVDQEDIDEIMPSKISSMPSGLVDQLTNREQFLDLLSYVMVLKERGPIRDAVNNQATAVRELTDELNGLVQIRNLNCVACHKSPMVESMPAANQGPNLRWSARRLNPNYLVKFIANPHQVKPGTNMPSMMEQFDEDTRIASAESIVHYLVSLTGNQFTISETDVDRKSIIRGRDLFHSVGCVACHSPRDTKAVEKPIENSVALGNLAGKYNPDALVEFLEYPCDVRSSGRMPDMKLTHREAVDLSSYLLQGDASTFETSKSWVVDNELAGKGKMLFRAFNCAACHTGIDASPLVRQTAELANVNATKGCLSGESGNWPSFHLTDAQTQLLRAALQNSSTQLSPKQQIDFTMASYRCVACHSRDNLGGVKTPRREYFKTTNLNLGEQGRIPPTLTGIGTKLKPEWMQDVLINRRSIRPYMRTRMPQYGEPNVGHLVDLFQQTDKLSATELASVDDLKAAIKLGLRLAGKDGLNCVACHTFRGKASDTMPAVDLTEMAQRLKKDWFYQYMLAPQKFSPNTIMPAFWPDGKAIRPDLPGQASDQVEGLWQYLLDGRQARIPKGVMQKPLEIVVTNEARMLRRRYPSVGKRGIGIGYPGGVNLTFDAEQMRLAAVWKGKFVDPGKVWYGQGSGMVRPLGETILLPRGPDLDNELNPWIVDEGRPPSHHFQGYALDKLRRPTLKYSFGTIDVEDYFTEYQDAKTGSMQLRRQIKMTSSQMHQGLRFRLAEGEKITADSDDVYRISERLKIHVASGQRAAISDDSRILQIPLSLNPNQTVELILEYQFE